MIVSSLAIAALIGETNMIGFASLIAGANTDSVSNPLNTNFVTNTSETNQVSGLINVIAKQFEFLLNGSNNITIHKNLIYEINVTSIDVIHSLFIYELGYKIDAIPGRVNIFYLQFKDISQEPTNGYKIICSEFCGSDHYLMSEDYPTGGAARIIVI